MADVLDRAARQVRPPGGVPHRMVRNTFALPDGRRYKTRCGITITGRQGAVLTTRPVGCEACTKTATATQRAEEFVEAILGGSP